MRRAGVQTPKKNELLVPDDAANNAFDPQAARYVYRRLQELEVPTVVVSRAAAYACPVPRALYDDLASTGHAVGVRIRDAQREAIARLWRRAHASGADRAHLPERSASRVLVYVEARRRVDGMRLKHRATQVRPALVPRHVLRRSRQKLGGERRRLGPRGRV
jgi:hypothetical protein